MPVTDVLRRDEPANRRFATRHGVRRRGIPALRHGASTIQVLRHPQRPGGRHAPLQHARSPRCWRARPQEARWRRGAGESFLQHAPMCSRPRSTGFTSSKAHPTVVTTASPVPLRLPADIGVADLAWITDPRPSLPLAKPTGLGSSAAAPATSWIQAMVSRDGAEFEAFRLLGDAWRSPAAATLHAGQFFDLVDVPEDLASPAWHHLRLLEVQCGAVFATDGRWNFFIPTQSGDLPWPGDACYLTDRPVCIPPRSARDHAHGLWWISRPSSGLFTHPIALSAALNAIVSSRSVAQPCVAEPMGSHTSGFLSPPFRSYGV